MTATGRLLAIARRPRSGAPMEEVASGVVTTDAGLDGDCKGQRFKTRQITVLAFEDWLAACAALSPPIVLAWTVRRANLLVEGIRLPRGRGSRLAVGTVELEVTAQTFPCAKMETAHPGLLRALAPDWRGGVTARVLAGGPIAIGDSVVVIEERPERSPRLP